MMRKTITRKLLRSTVNAFIVKKVDGVPVVENLEPVSAWGKLTDDEAKKLLAGIHGKDATIMINTVDTVEETYQIEIDKFVENAVKVEQLAMPFDDEEEDQ